MKIKREIGENIFVNALLPFFVTYFFIFLINNYKFLLTHILKTLYIYYDSYIIQKTEKTLFYIVIYIHTFESHTIYIKTSKNRHVLFTYFELLISYYV